LSLPGYWSVLRGKGAMPPWEDKLPVSMLQSAIRYLRIMRAWVPVSRHVNAACRITISASGP
jgi:hypothetical protein